MEEHFFHLHQDGLDYSHFTLSKEESQHCIKSLRGKENGEIGLWFRLQNNRVVVIFHN